MNSYKTYLLPLEPPEVKCSQPCCPRLAGESGYCFLHQPPTVKACGHDCECSCHQLGAAENYAEPR